jgi:glutamate-1-semialdehyde 2,1-aminomutase
MVNNTVYFDLPSPFGVNCTMLHTDQVANVRAALEHARREYTDANPQSRSAYESAKQWLPGANTRTVTHYEPFPLYIDYGVDSHVVDLDGHRYVDFLGEYTAGLFGHSHGKITQAIRAAIERGMNFGAQHMGEQRLAQAVCERFPVVEKVRFTNSGTEANLMTLSAARAFTGRDAIVVFSGAYHGGGLTFVNGPGALNLPFRFIIGRYNDPDGARDLLSQHASSVAAVLVEPMASSGGCIPAHPEFLKVLRAGTEKDGIILIFDEVVTSRLAPHGVYEALGIRPDLITLGKYLGGGMSFGAFGGRAELMEHFDPAKKNYWPHAGTFNNNVLTMAAGHAALTEVFTPEEARKLNDRGDALRSELNLLSRDRGYPMQFSGMGATMNVHMVLGKIERPTDAARGDMALRDLFFFELISKGIYLARRGMINVSLVISASDMQRLIAAVTDFVSANQDLLAAMPTRSTAAE